MLLMQFPTTALIGSTVKPRSDKKIETCNRIVTPSKPVHEQKLNAMNYNRARKYQLDKELRLIL